MNPKKVLLAEDDADDQNIFLDFLQHRKDIVLKHVVENGVELFEWLEGVEDSSDLPDLIILDQNMPKRNGIQTLQLLKQTGSYAHIPVMVYSTYTDQQLLNTCTMMGASAVMSKPVTQEGYNRMMNAILKVID